MAKLTENNELKADKARLLKAFRELEKEKTCDKCGDLLKGPKEPGEGK